MTAYAESDYSVVSTIKVFFKKLFLWKGNMKVKFKK